MTNTSRAVFVVWWASVLTTIASGGGQHLSAVSKRALNYTRGPEWFCQFSVVDVKGDFAYEKGVIGLTTAGGARG